MSFSHSPGSDWQLLFRTTDLIRDLYAQHHPECKNFKITIPQIKILSTVSSHYPSPLMLKDIASELRLTPGAISPLVDFLVKARLLERTRNAEDRRAISIELSSRGVRMRREFHKFFTRLTERLFSDVPSEKQQIFQEVLELLNDKLQSIMAGESSGPAEASECSGGGTDSL